MKHYRKLLSLLLIICISMTMLTGYIPVNAVTPETETPLESLTPFELPDIVDTAEAEEKGYISRVKTEEKDLYTFVFANGDGRNTMRIFSHPVKYVADDGSIRDISLDIEAKKDGGFVTADHEIVTTFESKLTDGITLEYNDVEIMLVPELGLGTMPTAELSNDGKVVTYEMNDITSFVYELTYAGFKEDIVVEEYTGQTEYEFTLFTNGLTLCEEYGSYYLVDAEGNVEATIGDIIVFTADERNNTMGSMTYETVHANQEYVLTIHLDADYLIDEDTVYPIRIDPTIEINYDHNGAGAIEDVTINQSSTFSGTSGSLFIGRHPAGSLSRVLMRFPNLSINGVISADQIISASVELRDLMCQGDEDITVECYMYDRMAPTWTESGTTTWSSVGSTYIGAFLDSNVISFGEGNVEGQRHRYAFDITVATKSWARGTNAPYKGLVFKANSTFENQTGDAIKTWYKTFSSYNRAEDYRPSLSITYTLPPSGGDSFEDAETLTLNTTYFVNIASAYEKKYFKFTPSTTGIYSFISSASAGDPYARLYKSSEQQLDIDDDSAGNYNYCLSYHLMAGISYYFETSHLSNGTGSYEFRVSNASASSKIDYTTMTLGTNKSISITIPHKIVCYKVTPPETKEYLFFSSNKTGDPEIWVYNSSFGYVDDNDDGAGGLNFRLAITLNAGNTYYIVLRHNYSSVGSFGLNSFYDADIPYGSYYLKNAGSLGYMDIDGPGTQEWVHQWSKHTGLQEKWRIDQDSNGYYTMRSEYGAKKYVGISSTSTAEDNIKLYSSISDSTRWKIYKNASNALIVIPKSATGKVLCAPDDAVGTKLRLGAIHDLSTPNRSNWMLNKYSLSINTFYDNAFNVRYGNGASLVSSFSDEISRILRGTVGLEVTMNAPTMILSTPDHCKLQRGFDITSTTINTQSYAICPSNPSEQGSCPYYALNKVGHSDCENCTSWDQTYRDFIREFPGSETVASILFTGSRLYDDKGKLCNRSYKWYNHGIILQEIQTNASVYADDQLPCLLHEISHEIGAPDHYHEMITNDQGQRVCRGGSMCFVCNPATGRPQWCTMGDDGGWRDDLDTCDMDEVYCEGCRNQIIEHLIGHHFD